ncbi:MAG: biotin carboxylase, partial [Pseudomonadota bacterium]
MDKIKGRAIITYGRSLMAVVIAHSLSKRGIEVISCDSIGMTAASFSKHTIDNFIHADPEEDLEQYLHDLETQITAHKPKDDCPYLLIPTFRDAKLLSKYHTRLDNLITLAVTDFDIIDRIDPKHHLFKTVEHLNLPAPKGWHPSSQKEVIEAMREIQLPALIKAVD